MVIVYGMGNISFYNYDDNLFKVVGILKVMGMFVDKILYILLVVIDEIYGGYVY